MEGLHLSNIRHFPTSDKGTLNYGQTNEGLRSWLDSIGPGTKLASPSLILMACATPASVHAQYHSPMATPEARFESELEIFRTEAEAATQFFFGYLAVHAVAYQHKSVHALLNRAPLFWNTCMGALQTSTFIALGRVFDQQSTHNLDKVLRIPQDHPEIFSKAALARRKQGTKPERPDWLDDYIQGVYEPTPTDFRRLRAHVRKWRRTYEANYRDARHRFFAHKEAADQAEVAALFSKGTNLELQRLFAFLGSLHQALWQLFFNGTKLRFGLLGILWREESSPRRAS